MRTLLRFRSWAIFGILITISFIIILADRGSLPQFVYALYAFPLGDKAGHFLLMGLLAGGINFLFPDQLNKESPHRLFFGTKIALVLVTVEEISQLVFASRSFSIVDLCFSYLGILLVDILIWRWKHQRG